MARNNVEQNNYNGCQYFDIILTGYNLQHSTLTQINH